MIWQWRIQYTHESLLTMALCRVVTGAKYVANLLSICGFVLTTVAFLSAVEKRFLTTVPVMPEYVDLVCLQNCFISKLSTQLNCKASSAKRWCFLSVSARSVFKLSVLSYFSLAQHVNFPTHSKNHIPLDLLITSADSCLAPSLSTLLCSPADHFRIFTKLYQFDTIAPSNTAYLSLPIPLTLIIFFLTCCYTPPSLPTL